MAFAVEPGEGADHGARELRRGLRFDAVEKLNELRQALAARRVAHLDEAALDRGAVDVPLRFPDFEDYWLPFLGGQGPAPAYVASLDDDQRPTHPLCPFPKLGSPQVILGCGADGQAGHAHVPAIRSLAPLHTSLSARTVSIPVNTIWNIRSSSLIRSRPPAIVPRKPAAIIAVTSGVTVTGCNDVEGPVAVTNISTGASGDAEYASRFDTWRLALVSALLDPRPVALLYELRSRGYEVAVIIHDGLRRMVTEQEDVFYYLTLMNENYEHPPLPQGAEPGILKGMYLLRESKSKAKARVQLLGSGTILREVLEAAQLLEADWGVAADVWSATSFTELRRDGLAAERWNLLHPEAKPRAPYVTQMLEKRPAGPVVAASDYLKTFADQIRPFIPPGRAYRVLGTDGFGRSDSRPKLRHFFEVNRFFVAVAALKTLADQGEGKAKTVADAIKKYGIDPEKADPTTV